jgi:hypothetical protein
MARRRFSSAKAQDESLDHRWFTPEFDEDIAKMACHVILIELLLSKQFQAEHEDVEIANKWIEYFHHMPLVRSE